MEHQLATALAGLTTGIYVLTVRAGECQHGMTNHVVDSSAIEVNRRRRRAKSDGLDVRKLLSMLMRYHQGERHVWQVVKVPSVEAEDHRHLHRD